MSMSKASFWIRMGLQETDKAICVADVKRRYDHHHVDEFEYQGYCSFTLLVSWPGDLATIGVTSGNGTPALAPKVRALDVHPPGKLRAYELSRIPGTPLSRLLPHTLMPGIDLKTKQEALITSFAHVVARGWPNETVKKRRDSVLRIDSPSMEHQSMLSLCTGQVGSCIAQKLQKLARELPDEWLRECAMITFDKICPLDDYPVVLNHGDLIPSNILVDEHTWQITGLVDWAEAEHLPFGTCLYGLEYLLGSIQPVSPTSSRLKFVCQQDAARLRQLFWTTLIKAVPELEGRREEIQVMRDLGILLWHGYAWDEGAIDRVVDEVHDGEELTKLRAFLSLR